MNPFTKIWFWLLILSIIGLILSFVFFETQATNNNGQWTVPIWVWVIFILSIVFAIISFILYCFDIAAHYKRLEIAEACGELPPPKPKKKIECPKKECVEKKVIECVQRKPCIEKKPCKPCIERKPCEEHNPLMIPKETLPTINVVSEEAFAAANLKPLETLAPQ
jgi:hypothetical protein